MALQDLEQGTMNGFRPFHILKPPTLTLLFSLLCGTPSKPFSITKMSTPCKFCIFPSKLSLGLRRYSSSPHSEAKSSTWLLIFNCHYCPDLSEDEQLPSSLFLFLSLPGFLPAFFYEHIPASPASKPKTKMNSICQAFTPSHPCSLVCSQPTLATQAVKGSHHSTHMLPCNPNQVAVFSHI